MTALPPLRAPFTGQNPDTALKDALGVIEHAITHHPRSLQRTIGPSEIGTPCDHCLAAKLAGWEQNEDIPWLPTVGTAVHTWLEEAFIASENNTNANHSTGRRYLCEQKTMVGHIGGREIWGSTDLVDLAAGMTVDWKIVGATHRLIRRYQTPRPRGQKPTALVGHIAVTPRSTRSLYDFFTRAGVCSTFFIADDGYTEQYLDTDWRSAADLHGGNRTISVETAGGSGADLSKGWSHAQLVAFVKLAIWVHETHGIPLVEMRDSKPTTHGIGYHRLGVDRSRYVSPSAPGWRIAGGERWSSAVGKTCPGDARIRQVPEIVKQARAGNTSTTPKPKPSPKPKPIEKGYCLDVDGEWGGATSRCLQLTLGTPVDGVLDRQYRSSANARVWAAQFVASRHTGSTVIRALQEILADTGLYTGDIDGLLGPKTIRALQQYLGTPDDGLISPASLMVKELQRQLNAGTFLKGKAKSIALMATEVLRGDHGDGHATRRRSLGVTEAVYQQVRAEVNRRA